MSTKEELVIENTRLKNKLALYREINHRQACIIKESLELNKPCQEYALYEPQPYKFEELKKLIGKPIFDDEYKEFYILVEVREEQLYKDEVLDKFMICSDKKGLVRVFFEKGRFFPVTKAMYQGDMK